MEIAVLNVTQLPLNSEMPDPMISHDYKWGFSRDERLILFEHL